MVLIPYVEIGPGIWGTATPRLILPRRSLKVAVLTTLHQNQNKSSEPQLKPPTTSDAKDARKQLFVKPSSKKKVVQRNSSTLGVSDSIEIYLFHGKSILFASFETVVQMIYKHAVPKPKSECDKTTQLGISFAGGYIAGILCAVVSHPADNLVSFLNNAKGATVGDVLYVLDDVLCGDF
ncbi:Mitochondrial [Carex littledalei]|uniref:Mitochondrial n=1 Tax=Carex littledalei TaxID=544730 RepID=A0A833V7V1_9POAL|nr:Mitochondrial [Carex littledalei]